MAASLSHILHFVYILTHLSDILQIVYYYTICKTGTEPRRHDDRIVTTCYLCRYESASQRLSGKACRTPVLTSPQANKLTKAQIFFKCENLQRAGAFKFRGAYNSIASLDESQKKRVWWLSHPAIMLRQFL